MEFEPLDMTIREDVDVKKVMNMHHEIVRLVVLGMKDVDIANVLGCTTATIRNVKKNPIVRDRIERLNGVRDYNAVDIGTRLREIAQDAVEVIADTILDENISLAVRAEKGFKVLDRVGHGPVHNVRGQIAHAMLTKDDIEEIKQRARESMAVGE